MVMETAHKHPAISDGFYIKNILKKNHYRDCVYFQYNYSFDS